MKSPPGDIFIYGIHPDTTLEDIVNDLKESDILIEQKDILKKSKDGSSLNSYKISVKAEDLQRALDPAIWPMRVKVREYIYYARKPQQQGGQGQAHNQGGQGHVHHQGDQPGQGGRSEAQGQWSYDGYGSGLNRQPGAYGGRDNHHQQAPGHHGEQEQVGREGVPTANRFEVLQPKP